MEFVSVRTTAIVALSILGAVVLFHLLVIAGVIPKTPLTLLLALLALRLALEKVATNG